MKHKRSKAEVATAQVGNQYPDCPTCRSSKWVKPYFGGGFRCNICNLDFSRRQSQVANTPGKLHVGGHVGAAEANAVSYIGIGDGASHLMRVVISGCVPEAEAVERAEFVVRACNSHADLVAALRHLLELVDECAANKVAPSLDDGDWPIAQARKALAQAERSAQ